MLGESDRKAEHGGARTSIQPTIKSALHAHLDAIPTPTVFTGWQLFEAMERATNRRTYPGTLLEYAREYCAISGAMLECIEPRESRYRYTPGARIGGAIVD